ncbi:hypothetical protein MN608_09549 [Microdochium nivale]|nr:hypothetical protein MN608_09549 [Microdochium nivale]
MGPDSTLSKKALTNYKAIYLYFSCSQVRANAPKGSCFAYTGAVFLIYLRLGRHLKVLLGGHGTARFLETVDPTGTFVRVDQPNTVGMPPGRRGGGSCASSTGETRDGKINSMQLPIQDVH